MFSIMEVDLHFSISVILLSCLALTASADPQKNANEEEAKQFLAEYDVAYGVLLNEATKASWNY